jgi:hypothetical protein
MLVKQVRLFSIGLVLPSRTARGFHTKMSSIITLVVCTLETLSAHETQK